jgi:ATP-dependent DNA ligase
MQNRQTGLRRRVNSAILEFAADYPNALGRRPKPFDHPEYLFELKYDGFRALAAVEYGHCTLYSRNGHPFASFAELATRIGNALIPRTAV